MKRYTKEQLIASFNSMTDKLASSGCWEWIGHIRPNGYGGAKLHGKSIGAHRLSWILFVGEIPYGMEVMHKCDNRKCANPEHLSIGTHQENVSDCIRKSRQAKGVDKKNAKLSNDLVIAIRTDCRKNVEIAKDYGVSGMTISRVKRCVGWKHVPQMVRPLSYKP